MAPLRPGWVRITSVDPQLTVTARLSDERPDVTQGFGGWQEVERPRRSPITTFKAPPALHLTLPILLDGWGRGAHTRGGIGDVSVEGQIATLERMGEPNNAAGEPPRLRIIARGGAVPFQGRQWVLDTLTWGDALMNAKGDRVRQFVSLALIEYVEDVHLQERSAANRRRAKAKRGKRHGAAQKRITAKRSSTAGRAAGSLERGASVAFGEGEGLHEIAARELGDASRWIEIAKLNGLRDPRAISPGQVLRLP